RELLADLPDGYVLHVTHFRCNLGRKSIAGSHGQRFSDRGLFSCPMLQRQVVNPDGTRRYRCPVQSKFAVTRPPPAGVARPVLEVRGLLLLIGDEPRTL